MDIASIALAALSEFPSTPIVVFDAEACCVAVFGERQLVAESFFGGRETIVGRPAEEYMGAQAAGFRQTLASVLASRESASIRSRATVKNGEFVLELKLWPLAGMPLVACALRDVSEADRLRREVDATEPRMQAFFEHTAQFVCELAADGSIVYVGSRARELAVEPESLIGSNIRDVARLFPGLHPDDASLVTASLTRFIEAPSDWLPQVARARDRDGRMRSFETSGGWYPGPDGERRGLLVFRESLAHAEPASAPSFSQLVAPRPIDAVLELAPDGTIARVLRLPVEWGGHGEDLVGRDVFSFLHPEEQDQARRTFALVLAGSPGLGLGRQPSILRWRDAQVGWHWFEVSAVAYETGSGETRVLEIARELKPLEVSAHLHPEQHSGLLQRDNLALLAGGVAHDFNNLLSISLGVADLMEQQLPSDSPLRPYLDEIITASRQAADLSRQLLAASGKAAAAALLPVDLNQVLRSQESLLRTGVPKSVQLEFALSDGPLWVNADASQIREVVLNLVVNAGEAIGEKRGTIRVATGRIRDLDPPDKQTPGDWALLEVTDDGPGIDEAMRRQIFEPRFTTKTTGHGLGLAVVANVVRRHAGRIHVMSADCQGTTFQIGIPPLPERAVQVEQEFASRLANPRHEDVGVLIVDDDDRVRRLCASMLGVAKFRAFEASDAEMALSLLEREPGIACAVVDLVMPDGDGLALIDALRQKRPGLRVVLCSGAVHRIPEGRADLVVLEKPFRYGQLIDSVWRALEARS